MPPIPFIEEERRRSGLTRLGFRSYEAYIESAGWKARRRAALAGRPRRCLVCHAPRDLIAHHVTYQNIGRETADDIVLLCPTCHRETHVLITRGRVDMAIAHTVLARRAGNDVATPRTIVLPPAGRPRPRERKTRRKFVA